MSFQGFDEDEPIAEINTTPLVDVMLVLLVIFMLAAPLLTKRLNVDLPKVGGTEEEVKSTIVEVALASQGAVYINGTPIAMDGLREAIAKAKREGATQLHVKADKSIQYDVLAQVMGIAQQEGIPKLGFITQSAQRSAAPLNTPQ